MCIVLLHRLVVRKRHNKFRRMDVNTTLVTAAVKAQVDPLRERLADAEGQIRELKYSASQAADALVLRLWRDSCPPLQELWAEANSGVRGFMGVTLGGAGLGPVAGRVIRIAVSKQGLTGVVPAAFGQLVTLEELHLGSNRLAGAVPVELGQLAALSALHLNGNQLTSVPAELGNLSSLSVLNLNGNQLTSVPAELGNLSSLSELWLNGNQLTSVPAELGNLSSVSRLWLSGNQLTSVPAELANLSSLIVLWLSENQLTSVPAALGRLRELGVHLILDDGVTIDV